MVGKSEAVESKEVLGSVSLHRMSPPPEISDFSLFSESVMFNLHMHTSLRTYLSQYFLCKAFLTASSLIYVFPLPFTFC